MRGRVAVALASSPATSSSATSSSIGRPGAPHTFYDGPIVTHLSSAETYDPVLRRLAIETIRDHGIEVHERGTVVVIEGPRFSTKSESKWFSDAGWEVINMTQYPEAWLCRELGMAVVNISLITDYDAGVHEGTEAVDAMSVLEVFAQNAERIQKVVLDLIGRFPADLDALGGAGRARADARRRPRDERRGHPPLRDGPVGVEPWPTPAADPASGSRSARSAPTPGWWLESARRLDDAGYPSVWCWDHFVGQGRPDGPGRRAMDDARRRGRRHRRIGLGTFVTNVMNRHPALLARMAGTVQALSGGRLTVGIGIGGGKQEHEAYGMDFPEPAERAAAARGGGRRHPGALDRRTGQPRGRVLPAARRRGPPACRTRRRGS